MNAEESKWIRYTITHMSCVENLVGIYSNHMVFRQNLSPLFREPSLFFRGDEFYKNLFRELSRRTVPFEEEIFTIWEYRHEDIKSIIISILYRFPVLPGQAGGGSFKKKL